MFIYNKADTYNYYTEITKKHLDILYVVCRYRNESVVAVTHVKTLGYYDFMLHIYM